ncbi:hypothetical protein [Nocardioides convexus]|uniref:hypothetical protein n=1 Tax=Nocardioides convexus TaxID=2712224 RepID=UPI0024188C00|nr:hypothetical protein [Nocardioides convexus]
MSATLGDTSEARRRPDPPQRPGDLGGRPGRAARPAGLLVVVGTDGGEAHRVW